MDISDVEDNPNRNDTPPLRTVKGTSKRQNFDRNLKTGQCEIFLTEADFDIMKPVLHQHTYGRFTEPGWFRLVNDKIIANKTLTNVSLNLQRHRFPTKQIKSRKHRLNGLKNKNQSLPPLLTLDPSEE